MQKKLRPLPLIVTLTSVLLLTAGSYGKPGSEGWKPNQLIEPEELVKMISAKPKDRPLVLQVGFEFLYQGGHIPGAIWAGPASRPDGIKRLKDAIKEIPRNKEIVIYCGCCPWSECPNIRPAFQLLGRLGFKNVKMLYIPINFEKDWISRGYPKKTGGSSNMK